MKKWDDTSNEAQNAFASWTVVGDYVFGTLIARRTVASTLPDREGEKQNIYEIKIDEGSYHILDDKKKVVEAPIVLSKGDIISVGGRWSIDSRMERVKIGQKVGLKFSEEKPATTKGYNPAKIIKVFTPKNEAGEFEMDAEWLEEQKEETGDLD